MKCIDFENRLNELLDDRLSPEADAALVAHAEACVDCREMLAAQENLFLGMAALQRRTPWVELGSRVLSELNEPATLTAPITLPPPVHRPLRWVPLLASAAVVLIAVGLGMWIVGRNNRGTEVAQPSPKAQDKERLHGLSFIKPGGTRGQKEVPAPPVVPAPKSVPQPEAIVKTPAPQEGPRFVPAPVPPQPFAPQPDIDGAIATIASQWQSSQWQVETIDVEHYAPGIRPIRESFEVAIDALLKTTIPQGKKESRPVPPQAQYGEMLDLA